MNVQIRPIRDEDIEAVVQFSLLAWEPIFISFENVLGTDIYTILYPEWRKSQSEGVEGVCRDRDKYSTWVAELDGTVAGFVAYYLKIEEKTGEVEMLAVHPQFQNRGVGTALNEFALTKLKEAGMELAEVGTGGDPGHAAARASYEKAGYTAFPLVRYYKKL